jgi:hypothetical protein
LLRRNRRIPQPRAGLGPEDHAPSPSARGRRRARPGHAQPGPRQHPQSQDAATTSGLTRVAPRAFNGVLDERVDVKGAEGHRVRRCGMAGVAMPDGQYRRRARGTIPRPPTAPRGAVRSNALCSRRPHRRPGDPVVSAGADAQTGSAGPVGHTAATCADYSNQAAAQQAADTRDADGDGVYCESLPCPSSSAAGGGGSSTPSPCAHEAHGHGQARPVPHVRAGDPAHRLHG